MNTDRRGFLAAGAALIGASLAARIPGPAPAVAAKPATTEDLLDEAYDRIAARFPDRNLHASNHAAMVVETLAVLGQPAAMEGWLDTNLQRFDPGRTATRRIDPAQWREGLGKPECYPDWQAFFRNEIAEHGAQEVLKTWVPRFTPGLASVAAHGVIRTGHAARAIAARNSPPRQFELATGLAYWAVNYEELPWDSSVAPKASVAAALAEVKPRPRAASSSGSLVAGLRLLQETPDFASVAGWIDASEPSRAISEIARAFAGLYLRNPRQRIAFCHAVTAPSSLRLLAPYLDAETLRAAVRHAWQTAAGIFVVYGGQGEAAAAEREPLPRDEIVARAIRRGTSHGIKLTEACLREHAIAPDPLLLLAAEDAATKING